MASGMYDAGPSSSTPLSYPITRRPPGSGPLSYERPLSRRRSPSPHRHYGNDASVYHSNYPNVYRPNYWSDRGSSYDGLSSSPDRFERSREPDVDPRDRSGGWGPHSESHWEPGSSFRREPMLAATRMFEPSETWKRTHDERTVHSSKYNPSSPVIDKLPDRSGRDFVESASERSVRNDRLHRDDDRHYRPSQSFAPEANGRSGYNSYRPSYDRDSTSSQMRKRSISGSVINDGQNGRCSSTRSSSRDSRTRSRSSSRERSQCRSSSRSQQSIRPRIPTRTKPLPRSTSSSRSQRGVESGARRSSVRRLTGTTQTPRRSYSRTRPSCSRSRSYSGFRSCSRSRSLDNKSRRRSSSRGRSLSRHRGQPTPDRVSEPKNERRSWSRSSIASSRASPPPPPTTTAVESRVDAPKPVSDTQMIEQPIKEPEPVIKGPPSPEPAIPDAQVPVSTTSDKDAEGIVQAPINEVEDGHKEPVTDSKLLEFARIPHPVPEAKESSPAKDEILPVEVDVRSLKARQPPVVDFTEDDIPSISESSSLQEVVRASIMTRLLHRPQTQEERVEPLIRSNQALVRPHVSRTSTTPEQLITEINSGERLARRVESFMSTKDALIEHFQQQQAALAAKVQRLQEEYLSLHERWLSRCRVLDAQNKLLPAELEPPLPSSSRTTRRTAATLGDAVRSDFEMEQIIASLGNDEATDPAHLSLKNHAVIPDMISVQRGSVDYVYDDTNLLVENPSEYYRPRTGMDDWTPEEEQIFQDRYAAHPKQFGIIADYIPDKTAAQCVAYYYLHKKQHIDFRKVVSQYAPKRRRRRTGKQKANALLTDIRQHDAEVNGDADAQETTGGRGRSRRVAARKVQIEETPTSTPTPEPEQKVRPKRRRTVAVRSGLSINNNEEEEGTDQERKPKRTKRQRKVKSAAIVDESQASIVEMKFIDQSDPSQRRKPPIAVTQWSDDDKKLFLKLLGQYGDDFKRIAASMPNKTTVQVCNFYKTNCDEMGFKTVAASAPKRSPSPASGDGGEGVSSTRVDSSAPMASLTSDNVEGVHHGDQVTTTVPDYVQMQTSSSWSTFSSANNSSATTRPSDANTTKSHSPSQLHVHNASTIPVASIYPTPPAGVQYPTGTHPYGAPSGYSYPPFGAPFPFMAGAPPHSPFSQPPPSYFYPSSSSSS